MNEQEQEDIASEQALEITERENERILPDEQDLDRDEQGQDTNNHVEQLPKKAEDPDEEEEESIVNVKLEEESEGEENTMC